MTSLLQSLTIPDPWQHQAARTLMEGRDVVVHAPTGAGKTYIFELMYKSLKGQAVFTVPTRALANDKLAEWQARGWDVGIATGDIAFRLDAKVVVATLETQKGRFLERRGPALLVIDEYQMIGDPMRGVNYELAVALAPPQTQLLLLSGSVGNPQDIVDWLRRIGRQAELISHAERPVPLEEIDLQRLPDRATKVTGWWPRMMANALRAELGPILLFAPRRKSAEDLAGQLAGGLGVEKPLGLTQEQIQLAGPQLTRLLRARVAFHHSGLSYAQRAGLIEPLAKAGELRVVVATMGLAAGINFSMRSVAISGTKYVAGHFEKQVQPDELLQMFGRAGRRGLDETGYALITPQPPRLHDARPKHLRRASQVDWPTLVAVMHAAAARGENPFAAALAVNQRLFSLHQIPLGVEHSLATGPMPCGLQVDMERARLARRGMVEMQNSRGAWEPRPAAPVEVGMGKAWIRREERWVPLLSLASTLDGRGIGNLCRLPSEEGRKIYGRELVLGIRRGGLLALAPGLKKLLGRPSIAAEEIEKTLLQAALTLFGGGHVARLFVRGDQLVAHLSWEETPVKAWLDSHGRVLIDPPERRELPLPCRTCFRTEAIESPEGAQSSSGAVALPSARKEKAEGNFSHRGTQRDAEDGGAKRAELSNRSAEPTASDVAATSSSPVVPAASPPRDSQATLASQPSPPHCPQLPWCLEVPITASPAHAWRRLGLIEQDGTPTRRGIIFSYFQHGEGLAIAAGLEDSSYQIDDLVWDLANLRAGPRFSGDDSPSTGRLAVICQRLYGHEDIEGYLESGVPVDHGAGASEALRGIVELGLPRQKLLSESLRMGDIERALVEWRSLLRHLIHAPEYDWERWRELKKKAAHWLQATEAGGTWARK